MNKNIQWRLADWDKQDIELSMEFGCSREMVRQARKDPRYGNGREPDHKKKRTIPTAESLLTGMETDGKTLPELAKAAGCSQSHAALVMRGLDKGYKRRPKGRARLAWDKFPTRWLSMTDKDIGALVGTTDGSVVAQWRSRHGYDRKGHHGHSGEVHAEKIVAAEMEVAR